MAEPEPVNREAPPADSSAAAPAGEPGRTAWWEWPFVVALMPFVFMRRVVERVASLDLGRPFRWAWEHLVLAPLRALGQLAMLPWRGLVWLVGVIRGPLDALIAWVWGLGSAVGRALRAAWAALKRALAWAVDLGLAPVRWIARVLASAGRSCWAAVRWAGRRIAAAVVATWAWIVRGWFGLVGLAARAGAVLMRPVRWIWGGLRAAFSLVWGGVRGIDVRILAGLRAAVDAIASIVVRVGAGVGWAASRLGAGLDWVASRLGAGLGWVTSRMGAGVRWLLDGVGGALAWVGRVLWAPIRFLWTWLGRLLALAGRALSTAGRWLWSWVRRIARASGVPFIATYRWARRSLRAFRDSAVWAAARRMALAPLRGARALLGRVGLGLRAAGARARDVTARVRQRSRDLSARARATARRATGRRSVTRR